MEVSDVRRRLRAAIEEARRRTAERRESADQARRAYDTLLPEVAVPTFHSLQTALTVLIAILVTYLASIYPALRASRVEPVEGLKGE